MVSPLHSALTPFGRFHHRMHVHIFLPISSHFLILTRLVCGLKPQRCHLYQILQYLGLEDCDFITKSKRSQLSYFYCISPLFKLLNLYVHAPTNLGLKRKLNSKVSNFHTKFFFKKLNFYSFPCNLTPTHINMKHNSNIRINHEIHSPWLA